MSDAIVVALISSAVSLIGIIITVVSSNRSLMNKMDKDNALSDEKMRGEIAIVKQDVQQLRGDVQKHNNLVERTYKLEEQTAVHSEKIDVANHRIADLEKLTAKA